MSKESLQKQADRAENIAEETLEEAAKEYRKKAKSPRQPDSVRPRYKPSSS